MSETKTAVELCQDFHRKWIKVAMAAALIFSLMGICITVVPLVAAGLMLLSVSDGVAISSGLSAGVLALTTAAILYRIWFPRVTADALKAHARLSGVTVIAASDGWYEVRGTQHLPISPKDATLVGRYVKPRDET